MSTSRTSNIKTDNATDPKKGAKAKATVKRKASRKANKRPTATTTATDSGSDRSPARSSKSGASAKSGAADAEIPSEDLELGVANDPVPPEDIAESNKQKKLPMLPELSEFDAKTANSLLSNEGAYSAVAPIDRLHAEKLANGKHKSKRAEDEYKARLRLEMQQGRQTYGGIKVSGSVRKWFVERNAGILEHALTFVPWVLQTACKRDYDGEGKFDKKQILFHRSNGVVVRSRIGGQTVLTARLAKEPNSAEMLSRCLRSFFTPLIDLIDAYRGDVITFDGAALIIFFEAVDDTKNEHYNKIVAPHGTFGMPDVGPTVTAALRSVAWCIEAQKRLHMFDSGVDGVSLNLQIGVGAGEVAILQVGGVAPPDTQVPRFYNIIAGPPLEQIHLAENIAKKGETCFSRQAWELVKDAVVEGPPVEARSDFYLLARFSEGKYTYPTVKFAAMENDNRYAKRFGLAELKILRHFVHSAVLRKLESGTSNYVNEARTVSMAFGSVVGLDVMTDEGATKAQDVVVAVQRTCYAHEGTLNKLLMNDKGLIFFIVFGLPPLVHKDDPTRATLCCLDAANIFQGFGLEGRFGLATGSSFCGFCGSSRRMEYSILGDRVILASRLMTEAPPGGVICDEETKQKSDDDIDFLAHGNMSNSDESEPTPLYQPKRAEKFKEAVGVTASGTIAFPSICGHGGDGAHLCSIKEWSGNVWAEKLLGAQFCEAEHKPGKVISFSGETRERQATAPGGSPFNDGGVIFIKGTPGIGKTELIHSIVTFAGMHFYMRPVFGTMGPRPGDCATLVQQLLKSAVGAVNSTKAAAGKQSSNEGDDFEALQGLVRERCQGDLVHLKQVFTDQFRTVLQTEEAANVVQHALNVLSILLDDLAKATAVCVVVNYRFGTNLFSKTCKDPEIFWTVVQQLAKLAQVQKEVMANDARSGYKPLVLLVVASENARTPSEVLDLQNNSPFLQLSGLTENAVRSYMGNYSGVDGNMFPEEAVRFVSEMTLGKPSHIRETMDQLQKNGCIKVEHGPDGKVANLKCVDIHMDEHVQTWHHTDMVGSAVCLLESMDPLEVVVLKMGTCFTGSFSLADLAASVCSRWADTSRFDALMLGKAVRNLVSAGLFERVEAPSWVGEEPIERTATSKTQHYRIRNALMRSVAGSMLLEAQKLPIKRQALIDRFLRVVRTKRLVAGGRNKEEQHIPWYYSKHIPEVLHIREQPAKDTE